MRKITAIKCTNVLVQASLGFYDEEGNLVGEETFPQPGGNVGAARVFYPHDEQLARLIEYCIEQAWAKVKTQAQENDPDRASDKTRCGDSS